MPPCPSNKGTVAIAETLSNKCVRFSIRHGKALSPPALPTSICGATAPLDPDQRLHRGTALEQVFAGLDQHTVNRNGTGYASKDEPCGEDEQRQGDGHDQQTLARRGNGQQPVELFTLFLCLDDSIVKRVKWTIEHDRA